jgi:hypothetical protein
MSQLIISAQDILRQVKLAGRIPEMVRACIAHQLIIQTAAELNIQNTPAELQEVADQFRLLNRLNSAQETLDWLAINSLSNQDFESLIRFQLLCMKLNEYLFKDKIKDHFIENQLQYQGLVLYEVILEDEDLAIELYLAVQQGEMNFFEVAHKYNKDEELRRHGGYRGIMYRKDLKPDICAAVFSAQPPCVLKPIVTFQEVRLIFIEQTIEPELNENTRLAIGNELFNQWLVDRIDRFDFKLDLEPINS